LIQDDPRPLVEGYAEHWKRLGFEGAAHFDFVRQRFNESGDPILLFVLLRTCRLGHVRFNRRGEFNVGYQSKPPLPPERVRALAERWHARLRARDVSFAVRDYREVHTLSYDVAYLDPPFATGKGRYYQGGFDHAGLFDWMRHQKGACLLSLNGYLGDADRRLDVPPDLFDEHLLLENGVNGFDRLGGGTPRPVSESLYIRNARILSRPR
jgi:site-specific DNA-adenine methylase